MRYFIWTVGCQMNKADSEKIAQSLEGLSLTPTDDIEQASVIVLNSCSVRKSAEDRVIGKIGALKQLKKKRPDLIVALAGCMVSADQMAALRQKLPHVDLFLRPLEIDPLLKLIVDRWPAGRTACPVPNEANRQTFSELREIDECSAAERTESSSPTVGTGSPARWVPIIYGCNNFCTYCIVPFRRGRERSRTPEEIVDEARHLVAQGAREITLLGQNVDSYGHDLPQKTDLSDLLVAMHEVEGLFRLRFLTSHPKDMSDKLIETVASLPKVCEYINLPVQSGDDATLKAMGRRYTVAHYRALVDRIRSRVPHVSLSTDLIVGFPGETVEQFQNSFALLQELRFDAVHVAMYSPRPGTAAARMVDDVPAEEKKRRLQMVEELQERIATENNAALAGQTIEVLVEGKVKGKWQGRTRTNKLVFFKHEEDWLGKMVWVNVEKPGPWSLQGRVVAEVDLAA